MIQYIYISWTRQTTEIWAPWPPKTRPFWAEIWHFSRVYIIYIYVNIHTWIFQVVQVVPFPPPKKKPTKRQIFLTYLENPGIFLYIIIILIDVSKKHPGSSFPPRRLGSRQVWEVDIVWLHVKMTCDVLKKGALFMIWSKKRQGLMDGYSVVVLNIFDLHPYLILREWNSWISWDFLKKHNKSYILFWVICDKTI